MSAKRFIAFAAVLLAVTGCNKPESGGGKSDPDPEKPITTSYFKATINDLYLQGPDDTGFNFMFETNMADNEWSVEADADWLKIVRDATTVAIIPSGYDPRNENGTHAYPAPRSGSVTLKAGSVFNKTFTVVQESYTFINSEYDVKMSPAGASVNVPVRHNCYSWTATSDATWITLKKIDTSTLTITTSARSAGDSNKRSAVVKIQSDRDPQTSCTITVSDADSNLGGEDYNYGDHTDWD